MKSRWLGALLSVRRVLGSELITRHNLYPAASITGIPNPGFSSGQALTIMQQFAREILPHGMDYLNIGGVGDFETLWSRGDIADWHRLEGLPMTEEIRSQRVFFDRKTYSDGLAARSGGVGQLVEK